MNYQNWDTHPHRTAMIQRQPQEIELDKRKVAAMQAKGHKEHPWPPHPEGYGPFGWSPHWDSRI
jgi:hypothetical protein